MQKMKKFDYEIVELDLDEETIFYLKSEAEKNNITIDEVVNRILKDYLEKYNGKEEK